VSILGHRVLRREDPKFLTTGGIYADDLEGEGALWATYVRSTVAHARLISLDGCEARGRPGVVAVYTASDLDVPPVPLSMPMLPEGMARPMLATGVVRFVGEPVAVVLTEERYQGEDAAEGVLVEYEPLPVVVDPEAALEGCALLFPEVGTNVALDFRRPLDETLFDECDVVVNQRLANQRVAPCPMEVRSGLASWGEDGRLTQWASIQHPHGVKAALAVSTASRTVPAPLPPLFRSGHTWRSSRWTSRPGASGCNGWWQSTTPAPSSIRCWLRDSATGAWPRGRLRPCSKRSATIRTGTRSRPISPTTP
jgi:aerobic carbon-monoxide dehydrogenase large subunit